MGAIARSADPRVQVALGGAAYGRAGFRATHLQAQQAQLGMAGLRGADMILHPTPSPGMDWGNVAESSTPTDSAGYRRLVAAWQAAMR